MLIGGDQHRLCGYQYDNKRLDAGSIRNPRTSARGIALFILFLASYQTSVDCKNLQAKDTNMTIRNVRDHGQRYRPRMACLKKVGSQPKQHSLRFLCLIQHSTWVYQRDILW